MRYPAVSGTKDHVENTGANDHVHRGKEDYLEANYSREDYFLTSHNERPAAYL